MSSAIKDCLPPVRNTRKPKVVLPKGSIDTHVHVFEKRYPLSPAPQVKSVDAASVPREEERAMISVRDKEARGYLVLDSNTVTGRSVRYAGRNASSLGDVEQITAIVRHAERPAIADERTRWTYRRRDIRLERPPLGHRLSFIPFGYRLVKNMFILPKTAKSM